MKNNELVLLVEDDRVDVMTIKRAMRDLELPYLLQVAGNGVEALEYLENSENQLPGLILLDINMPRMNGIEFLQKIKSHEKYRRIPVVMLTTSSDQRDRLASFDSSVAGYMIKPVEYDNFLDVLRLISSYWELSQSSNE